MYSLNAPVPAPVARLAGDLAGDLPAAEPRPRGEHSLLVKRLVAAREATVDHLVSRAREALAGAAPVEARVTGVECFEEPVTGTGPVVYLAVESPGLEALHRDLCEVFDPVPHLEGEAYVPHVTVARGGDLEAARQLCERAVEVHTFVVEDLLVWDARNGVAAARFSLPV